MRTALSREMLSAMRQGPGFFILHELRLSTGDDATRRRAAKCLAELPEARDEQRLPLFVSIDDRRDVACLRHVGRLPSDDGDEAGRRLHEALTPEAEVFGLPRYYTERAAMVGERAVQSYYRMAVTESGINEEAAARTLADGPARAREGQAPPGPGAATAAGLLWIGTPMESAAGLLVVTGHPDATDYSDSDPTVWPLPTSRQLGVRIYEGGAY